MGTLGNKPAAGFQSIEKQSITGNGGTSYALDHAVTNVNDLEVFVNNVRQEPTTAYTLSGQNIVMSEAIANTDSFYVIYQSRAFAKAVPADTSVTTAMIQDDAITSAKLATNIAVSGGTIEPTASFSNASTGYTQGSIALKSDTTSSPQNRGQGVFLFNEANDTTWYAGTSYQSAAAGSRPFDFNFKSGTTSLDAETASTSNVKTRIHASGLISSPAGIELGSGVDATAANTLDDYEEGDWTPQLKDLNGNEASAYTSGYPKGTYLKVGRHVWINFSIRITNKGSMTGNYVHVGNLPFNRDITAEGRGTGTIDYYSGFASSKSYLALDCSSTTSVMWLVGGTNSTGSGYVSVSQLNNACMFKGGANYIAS